MGRGERASWFRVTSMSGRSSQNGHHSFARKHEGKIMLPSESFKMRASLIRGFLNVTANVENAIKVNNLSPENRTTVTEGKGSWSKQELWMAAKIVSQFNFITAFELSLKLLLRIAEDSVKPTHNLTQLYDSFLEPAKGALETLFETHVLASMLVVGRAFRTGTTPSSQDEVHIHSLRDFCAYCDGEAKFFTSRYAYENIETDKYLHFIYDIGGLLSFLDEVEQVTIERWKAVSRSPLI